jgi:hypothetical protein
MSLVATALTAHAATDVETRVRSYFADIPVMIEIARCESGFRQFGEDNEPLDGGAGGMIGVFQIHEQVHQSTALSLGHDIRTLEGNLGYARYLYEQEGVIPWISAYPCWQEAADQAGNEASVDTSQQTLSTNLSFGMTHPEVRLVQRHLNRIGFKLAETGPGSPGNETSIFGALTRSAVERFQCSRGIACTGSSAFGVVDSQTRAALIVAEDVTVSGNVSKSDALQTTSEADIESLKQQILQLTKTVTELQQKMALLNGLGA